MKRLLPILLLFVTLEAFSQDTIPVSTTYKEGAKNEEYFVNKEGNKIGKYIRYTRYGKVYTEGQYDNGVPVGIWNYYRADTTGALVQTLDFSTHKETYVDSVNVNSLVCGPRYFGGNTAKQEYVQLRIKTDFTAEEQQMMKGKMISAIFEVDEKTLTTYAVTVEDNALPVEIRTKIQKIVLEMPAWLPPVCNKNGEPVWRMSVVFVF